MTAARYRAACAALELPVWRPGMRAVAVRPAPLEPVCSRMDAADMHDLRVAARVYGIYIEQDDDGNLVAVTI